MSCHHFLLSPAPEEMHVRSAGWQACPAEVQHASTTANLLKEEENGLTNLWSPSFTSAADTAGGTHGPNGFIYLSVLILAQIGRKQADKGQEIPQL